MARKTGVPNRNYPPLRLGAALRVPRAIADQASGMRVSRLTLAELLGTTPGSSVFTQLVASSRFYGLTTGGINSHEYGLTDLGEQVTGHDEAVQTAGLKAAVMMVEPFKTFFDAFASKKVPGGTPAKEFLVKRAAVPEAHAEACLAHILDDAQTAGLTRTLHGAQWVDLEGTPSPRPEDGTDPSENGETAELVDGVEPLGGDESEKITPEPPKPPEEPARPRAIFVAGRKGKSLDQLLKILDEYKLPYLLAEDEPHSARPISSKVADTMRQCGAAIIVFTPDEELRDLDGNPVWRPSQNVIHELGASGAAYGNQIVIFREERVTLAANYSDIGHIVFKDGELNAKAIELFRELIAFGLVKVSVG
jgi:Predicted nucleotide-binding protein containing TIR-like domain